MLLVQSSCAQKEFLDIYSLRSRYMLLAHLNPILGPDYFPVHQSAVTNSIHLQSTYTPHLQYLHSEAHLKSSRTYAVKLFCGNSQHFKAVGYLCRRAPLWIFDRMFDRILNATLLSTLLLQLKKSLRRSLQPLELHILDSPCPLILLIYTNNKKNSATRIARLINSQTVSHRSAKS